ncbi:MAG: hypothetical protein EZS28_010555 [Streblomastix strix]|uniref:Uncharacterized protein n=1 Tax=Streblomastix strix TaxID=222440 RepID=A0A5J4WG97_9EUKA|nr:MAG: hypothetical protein EZS28_010555 [Streblomastix strix]
MANQQFVQKIEVVYCNLVVPAEGLTYLSLPFPVLKYRLVEAEVVPDAKTIRELESPQIPSPVIKPDDEDLIVRTRRS